MLEVRPSFMRTGGLFILMAASTAMLGGLAHGFWDRWVAAGVLTSAAIAVGIFALGLLWRLVRRPVMLRVDADGIYLHRLGLQVPWTALDRVEWISHQGAELFALIEAKGGHAVFQDRKVVLGAGLNARLDLPDLPVSLSGMDATVEVFAAAIKAVGAVPLVDRRSLA